MSETPNNHMTVQELYDHIVKQITPEQALMKFLEGGLIQYEKLKFDNDQAVHPLFIMAMAAMEMGWNFGIEKDRKEVEGLITGTHEYMERWRLRK